MKQFENNCFISSFFQYKGVRNNINIENFGVGTNLAL